MSDLFDRLDERKMPSRDVTICLDMQLLARRDEAMKNVRPSRRVEDDRMVSPRTDPQGVVAELERQILEKSITLRVRGVDRVTYNKWILECPPRKGAQEPFDPSTFFMHAAKKSAVYVDRDGAEHEISADEWARIDKMLTDGEHDRLAQAVVMVNRSVGTVDVGFFANASEMIRGYSETSELPDPSASPRGDSGAGSRKKSTSKK